MKRTAMMLLVLLITVPSYAGFNDVLGHLRDKLGSDMWVPFFGLARTVVRVGHPGGVHDVQLAVFERKGSFDPLEASRIMRSAVGRDFTPLVQVRSKRDREWTFIYAHPMKDMMELMILTNDGSDTVLVRVVVDPDRVVRELGHPNQVAMIGRR
jgi:hypothetical protein